MSNGAHSSSCAFCFTSYKTRQGRDEYSAPLQVSERVSYRHWLGSNSVCRSFSNCKRKITIKKLTFNTFNINTFPASLLVFLLSVLYILLYIACLCKLKGTGLFTLNVNIRAPIKHYRPCSSLVPPLTKGVMKFHLRNPHWFSNCQKKKALSNFKGMSTDWGWTDFS
jgi:hypothetical protein